MRVNKNERVVYIDVDETLITHKRPQDAYKYRRLYVKDPTSKREIVVYVNEPMVRLLIEESHRKAHVRVWSRGGWEWAKNVIEALKLTKYVKDVETKPMVYFDDIPIEEWLPYRVWLPMDTDYKNKR